MRILIVDDDDITRAMLRAAVEPLAGEIHEVSNGTDALRTALERFPHVVILDAMMPGVDGYEICYMIKTAPSLQGTRVIMFTARDDAGGISTGREALADAYLLKPLDRDLLLETIRSVATGNHVPFPAGRGAS